MATSTIWKKNTAHFSLKTKTPVFLLYNKIICHPANSHPQTIRRCSRKRRWSARPISPLCSALSTEGRSFTLLLYKLQRNECKGQEHSPKRVFCKETANKSKLFINLNVYHTRTVQHNCLLSNVFQKI